MNLDHNTLHALVRACPRINPSHPRAIDNTEHRHPETDDLIEPAKEVLCYECQRPIPAGKGVQESKGRFTVLRHSYCVYPYHAHLGTVEPIPLTEGDFETMVRG